MGLFVINDFYLIGGLGGLYVIIKEFDGFE